MEHSSSCECIKVTNPKITFDLTSVEDACATLPNSFCEFVSKSLGDAYGCNGSFFFFFF